MGFVACNEEEAASQLATAVELLKTKGGQESAEHPMPEYITAGAELIRKAKWWHSSPGRDRNTWIWAGNWQSISRRYARLLPTWTKLSTPMDCDRFRALIFPIPAFDKPRKSHKQSILTSTEHAQPAIGTLSAGMYKLLQQAGFKARLHRRSQFRRTDRVCGQQVFTIEEALFHPGKSTRAKPWLRLPTPDFDAGTMLAVKGDVQHSKRC